MSEHLEIIANCIGDETTAISSCQKLAESYKKNITLNFKEGFSITVRPTSDVQDLVHIWLLEIQKIRSNPSNK